MILYSDNGARVGESFHWDGKRLFVEVFDSIRDALAVRIDDIPLDKPKRVRGRDIVIIRDTT